MALQGRGQDISCHQCGQGEGIWRCKDCISQHAYCTPCFRQLHVNHIFHRVESWNGSYFRSAWPCQADVEVHLGHGGNKCPSNCPEDNSPTAAPVDRASSDEELDDANIPACDGSEMGDDDSETWDSDEEDPPDLQSCKVDAEYGNGLPKLKGPNVVCFVDTSGVHKLRVHMCHCPNTQANDLQFMAMGFFPASVDSPKTVFTFSLLDDLRLNNLECHTPFRSYWKTLVRKTSCEFPLSVPVSRPPCGRHSTLFAHLFTESIQGATSVFATLAPNEISKVAWVCA